MQGIPIFAFTRKELFFVLAVFLLGFLLGATIISAYSGRDLDKLILENKELKTELAGLEKQLEQLDLKFKNRLIIQSINPYLDTDLNKHTQQEIIKKIRSLLDGFVGKEINEVDPLLLHNIINEASIIVEKRSYQLSLSYLVVSDKLQLYLKVKGDQKNNNEE
ncbi:MAG: hypothetical protein ACHQYO_05355 [Halanaerobiales bacterium]